MGGRDNIDVEDVRRRCICVSGGEREVIWRPLKMASKYYIVILLTRLHGSAGHCDRGTILINANIVSTGQKEPFVLHSDWF